VYYSGFSSCCVNGLDVEEVKRKCAEQYLGLVGSRQRCRAITRTRDGEAFTGRSGFVPLSTDNAIEASMVSYFIVPCPSQPLGPAVAAPPPPTCNWQLVFRQTARVNHDCSPQFASDPSSWTIPTKAFLETTSLNADNVSHCQYSVLNRLEDFRGRHGKFTFRLRWPDFNYFGEGERNYNTWRQAVNPVTNELEPGNARNAQLRRQDDYFRWGDPAVGYEPIDIHFNGVHGAAFITSLLPRAQMTCYLALWRR
jgi:hypothetical protein